LISAGSPQNRHKHAVVYFRQGGSAKLAILHRLNKRLDTGLKRGSNAAFALLVAFSPKQQETAAEQPAFGCSLANGTTSGAGFLRDTRC